jgi:hypothetical protein
MSADHGLLIGWTRIVAGKEELGGALFGEALEFWGQLQHSGAIESFEPVFLGPHGGDMNGFILVRGDSNKLHQIMESDEYLIIESKASNILEGHGVINAFFGDAIRRRMELSQRPDAAG